MSTFYTLFYKSVFPKVSKIIEKSQTASVKQAKHLDPRYTDIVHHINHLSNEKGRSNTLTKFINITIATIQSRTETTIHNLFISIDKFMKERTYNDNDINYLNK